MTTTFNITLTRSEVEALAAFVPAMGEPSRCLDGVFLDNACLTVTNGWCAFRFSLPLDMKTLRSPRDETKSYFISKKEIEAGQALAKAGREISVSVSETISGVPNATMSMLRYALECSPGNFTRVDSTMLSLADKCVRKFFLLRKTEALQTEIKSRQSESDPVLFTFDPGIDVKVYFLLMPMKPRIARKEAAK